MEDAYLTEMRFHQDSSSASNVIRSYATGEIKINDAAFQGPVIVSTTAIEQRPEIAAADELTAPHAAAILAHEPEVVLLGTGPKQLFPAPEFGATFLRAGVGFEVMDTGAACRTFNVLVAENRRVVALLIP
jgi:uncharacterized protein